MMSSFEIIPAIDLIDGKCVRLKQGDFGQITEYAQSPVEVAKSFEAAGIRRLHLVDLDGARGGAVKNLAVLEAIAGATTLLIDFGGGVKSTTDVQSVLDAGARWVTIGSLAVKRREWFLTLVAAFGADCFFIGADVFGDKLAVHGWLEKTDVPVFDFIKALSAAGLRQFFCTDISKDGMMQGASVELYRSIISECPGIALTASGGVTSIQDLYDLRDAGCSGAIIGKAIYEGNIKLEALQPFLSV